MIFFLSRTARYRGGGAAEQLVPLGDDLPPVSGARVAVLPATLRGYVQAMSQLPHDCASAQHTLYAILARPSHTLSSPSSALYAPICCSPPSSSYLSLSQWYSCRVLWGPLAGPRAYAWRVM